MISTFNISKRGKIREQNQDRANIWCSKDERVFCMFIADGMGGHFGGEKASEIVEISIKKQFLSTDFLKLKVSEVPKVIYKFIKNCQKSLIKYANKYPNYSDMGTTIVLAILIDTKKFFVYHAGDSRAYLLDHSNYFRQVTIDHNLKNYSDYRITSQEAFLIHALGPNKFSEEDEIQNSCQLFNLENNHKFTIFLTTDGTLQVMNDIDFYQFITSGRKIDVIANNIVDEAIQKGSTDNCTVAILHHDGNK